MLSRRHARAKFLALVLAGGVLLSTLLSNCAIWTGQVGLTMLDATWFITCEDGPLFSGGTLVKDCIRMGGGATDTTGAGTTAGAAGAGL